MKNSLLLFFILTLVMGIVILFPFIDYQPIVAQGDHGRDLYCFKAIVEGERPYHDFWWVYGPFMLYYYAFFFKWLGITIQSILFGKLILNLISGILIFFNLSLISPPIFAFFGGLWFFTYNPDFFITYNHTGSIPFLLTIIYCALLYLKTPKLRYLYVGLGCAFIFSFIKLNFGLGNLYVFAFSIFLIDLHNKSKLTNAKKIFYLCALIVTPLLSIGIHYLFVKGLPMYAIRQCFPYFKADHPYHASIWTTAIYIVDTIVDNMSFNLVNISFALLILLSIAQTFFQLFNKNTDAAFRYKHFLIMAIFILFYLFNLHEFLVSGVFYRSFWAKPISFLLIFYFLAMAISHFPRALRILFFSTLCVNLLFSILNNLDYAKRMRIPSRYLLFNQAKVYVGNDLLWVNTVRTTTQFLITHLKENELFFALPYDPLYYFLAEKKSPSRQLIFFDHINILEEQEKTIIQELEQNKVNYVLLSNRETTLEPELGSFGKTYCPLLFEYIQNNFEPVATFGDWGSPPGWAINHATRILKRKNTY